MGEKWGTNLGWWQGRLSWYEQSGNGSGIVDKQRRQRYCWERYSSSAGDRQRVRAIRKGFRGRFVIRCDELYRLACAVCMKRVGKESGCRTYANSATAQTRPNEAAELGIRSVQTYPALWLLLFLFVGVHCRHRLLRHSIREILSVRALGVVVYTCMRLYARLLQYAAWKKPPASSPNRTWAPIARRSNRKGEALRDSTPGQHGTWQTHVARQGKTDN